MVWKNKKKKPTKYENYSIVNKLKSPSSNEAMWQVTSVKEIL